MAKVLFIFEDTDAGPQIEVDYGFPIDQPVPVSALTDAQRLALKSQELIVQFIEKQDGYTLMDVSNLDMSKMN